MAFLALGSQSPSHSLATGLARDLRYAARQYRKSLGFTVSAVLTLALGIGFTTAIFSVVEAVLLRPLPYRAPQKLVVIWQTDALHRDSGAYFNSYREFQVFQQQSRSFDKLAALTWATGPKSTLWNGKPIDMLVLPASVDFFALLGEPAEIGRTFAESDLRNSCTVVLSNHFWRQKLGAPADILSRRLTVNNVSCQIAGVMSKSFAFYPVTTDAWTLITPADPMQQKPWQGMVGVFGRLKNGVSRTAAESELTAIQAHVVQEAPPDLKAMQSWTPDVLPLQSNFIWLAGRNLRKGLWLLFAASGVILAIAAVNVGGLVLGRALERGREIAVRSALGSSHARLLRQSLTESALLASWGTVAGFTLAFALVRWFTAANPVELPPGTNISLDYRVLLFAITSGIIACAGFAILPTWHNARLDVNELLKAGGPAHSGAARSARAAQALVVIQVALSMMLLVAAAVLSISMWKFTGADLGYRTDQLFTARINLSGPRYADADSGVRFADTLAANIGGLPGVQSVAIGSDYVPRGMYPLSIAGRPTFDHAPEDVAVQDLSPSGFATLEVPLLRGRRFDQRDQNNTAPVAIVNQALARAYFPGADPLGHSIKLSRDDPKEPWLTIVGVVADVKTTTVFQEMGYIEPPAVYRPLAQTAPSSLTILTVSQRDPQLADEIQKQLSMLDPNLVLGAIDGLHAERDAELAQPRFRAALFAGFALLALVLTVVGLYASLSQLITRRTRDISIRMALGADRVRVLSSVLRQACAVTAAGVGLGALCAAFAVRLARGLIYGIQAGGAIEFASAAGMLLLFTIAGAFRPAWRAASIDPVRTLRNE